MRTRLLAACAVIAAAAGTAHAATVAVPQDCGDIPAAPWFFRDTISGRTIGGRFYTVSATHVACAKARSLAARMTYKKSPAPGVNKQLLPGYTCLISVPAGMALTRGGCAVGTGVVVMMGPNVKSFTWHTCEAIPSRHEHMRCTVQRG